MWIYQNKNVMSVIYKHRVSYNQLYLATAKTKSEIVYNIANMYNICFTIKFGKFISPKTFLLSYVSKFHHALSDTM